MRPLPLGQHFGGGLASNEFSSQTRPTRREKENTMTLKNARKFSIRKCPVFRSAC